MLTTRHTTRTRRAVELLEFTFVFPLILFMAMFIIDMGRLGLTYGALNDAAYTGARAGAAIGLTGGNRTHTCAGPTASSVVAEAFCESITAIPGVGDPATVSITGIPQPRTGNCTRDGDNSYVVVSTAADVDLFTPGLEQALVFTGGTDSGIEDTFRLTTTATVRCEVVVR